MNSYKVTIKAECLRQSKDSIATDEESMDHAHDILLMIDATTAKEAIESVSHALTTLVNTQRGRR